MLKSCESFAARHARLAGQRYGCIPLDSERVRKWCAVSGIIAPWMAAQRWPGGFQLDLTQRACSEKGLCRSYAHRFEVPGGLAAGHERGGNYYDFGVHQLHSNDEAIFDDIKQIMGKRLIPVEKKALIRYGDGFRRYPLEFFDLISGVPPWTLARAMIGLLVQQARNRLRPSVPVDAEGALIQLYGHPLYVFFFRDFTHQYWGIPPTELSAAFVGTRMPRLSAVEVIKKAL